MSRSTASATHSAFQPSLLAGLGQLSTRARGSIRRRLLKSGDAGSITSPISGTLQAFKVDDGATVEEGDLIAVMEAMKMETQVTAPCAGTIRITANVGDYLQAGTEIARIEVR